MLKIYRFEKGKSIPSAAGIGKPYKQKGYQDKMTT